PYRSFPPPPLEMRRGRQDPETPACLAARAAGGPPTRCARSAIATRRNGPDPAAAAAPATRGGTPPGPHRPLVPRFATAHTPPPARRAQTAVSDRQMHPHPCPGRGSPAPEPAASSGPPLSLNHRTRWGGWV